VISMPRVVLRKEAKASGIGGPKLLHAIPLLLRPSLKGNR
jgi:hypothetical protein